MVVETAVAVVVMVTVVVVAVMTLKSSLSCPAGLNVEVSVALGSCVLEGEQSALSRGIKPSGEMNPSGLVIMMSVSEVQLGRGVPESMGEDTCSVVCSASSFASL